MSKSDLVGRRPWGWVGLGRARSEPTAVAEPVWGGSGGVPLKMIPSICSSREKIGPFDLFLSSEKRVI